MTELSPTRSNIAGAINAAHAGVEAAKREGAQYAAECGRLLMQAKGTVPHGSWDGWLRLNTAVSPRTAQLYMRIAKYIGSDPEKAQRVAGLSVRAAAAEATKLKSVGHNPLSAEGEAWLAEFHNLWREGDQMPHAKEAFAREIHRRGDITLEQRDRMIKGAWSEPTLTGEARQWAAQSIEYVFRHHVPADKLKAALPVLRDFAGSDLAIALGDALERRHHQ